MAGRQAGHTQEEGQEHMRRPSVAGREPGGGPSRRTMLAGAIAGAGLAGCGQSNAREFLASDYHPDDYPTVQAMREMGRLLSEQTAGRLKVKVFAGGQLGSERDTLEITSFGGLDLNRVNLAPLNAIEPLTVVGCLPFLFRSTDHMRGALDSEIGDEMLASLRPHGLIGLCFYDSGSRSFYNTGKPILSPDDMRGMKIRVPNSDLYVAMIKALGADATPMSLGEVYQSLMQGVIDGAENNWPSYYAGRHFEAAPFYSLTRHMMTPEVLVMSASRWDKLSRDDQQLVRQAAKASVPYMRGQWDARVAEAQAAIALTDVQVNEVEDLSAFSDLMKPVWDRFLKTDAQQAMVSRIQAWGQGA